MNVIDEQVRKLRGRAQGYARYGNWDVVNLLINAADTIEMLSMELQEKDVESNKWIDNREPDEGGWYLTNRQL